MARAPSASISATRQEVPVADIAEHDRFDQIVARYHARLYRVALGVLGDAAEAEDALQEAWLAAFRHRDQFQGRSELGTWLTRIVINAARGRRRKARARPAVELEVCLAAGHEFADQRPSPEAKCLDKERRRRLRHLLRRLSPSVRRALELCDLEGLSCRQAAETLGIQQAALKCRLFRGRARLATFAAR
jgi:RNA polymerase sigma-70 factor (ECF subfamily)